MTAYRYELLRTTAISSRLVHLILMLIIVELTVATAYIHLSLGGLIFALNGFGYLALAGAYFLGAALPFDFVRRLSWLPRIGLAGFALITIGAYLVIGPYWQLGWIAKGIEVAIIGLVIVDVLVD
jgi:hypothetical protein